MPIFRIPEVNLEALRKTVNRLIRTATRLGCQGVVFRETGETALDEYESDGRKLYRTVHLVEIEGAAPRIPDWEFLAAVEPAEVEGLNLLHVFGETPEGSLDSFRTCELRCDHCRANRRRVRAYIVRRESDGHVAMVGSDCLAHYIGHDNPEDVARAAEIIALLQATASEAEDWDWGGFGGGRATHVGLDTFLTYVAASIRAHGWVSRSEAKVSMVVSSADSALEGLIGLPHNREKWLEGVKGIQPVDGADAAAAIAWAREMKPRGDYEWNIWTVAQGEVIPFRQAGIAASIVSSHKKHQGEELRRRAAAAQSHHIGTVGKRETFTLVYEGCRTIESDFSRDGVTYLLRFTEGAGNLVVWFSSKPAGDLYSVSVEMEGGRVEIQDEGLQEGCAYRITATVKKHDSYRDVAQTVVTRGRVKEEVFSFRRSTSTSAHHSVVLSSSL